MKNGMFRLLTAAGCTVLAGSALAQDGARITDNLDSYTPLRGMASQGSQGGVASVCTLSTDCQNYALENASNSDGVAFRSADNFVPAVSGDVTTVCWWGAYLPSTPAGVDDFMLTIYDNAGGLPGAIVGGPFSQSGGTLSVSGPRDTGDLVAGTAPIWEYSGVLNAPVSLTAGETYWLEITNAVPSGETWFWEWSHDGDDSFVQDEMDGYDALDIFGGNDTAWCMDIAIAAITQACCLPDGTCTDATIGDCAAASGNPQGVGSDCASTTCTVAGPGDECTDPFTAVDGVQAGDTSDNFGSLDDTSCTSGDLVDEWWTYTATCSGDLTVSLCGSTYDTALALFLDCSFELVCNDDSCGLQSVASAPISIGEKVLIRVSGFGGQTGAYTMDISCQPFGIQACCLPGGDCQDLPGEDCTALGGTPQGAATSCAGTACPIPDLVSPDGSWRAQMDAFGQIEALFPPDQPTTTNAFESLVYAASDFSGGLSERVETSWAITEGPSVSPDLSSSHTRFENGLGLAIEVDNLMIDGPTGGVQVTITCVNKTEEPVTCKTFYYVDLDILGDFGDDEAVTVLNGGGDLRAIEQDDFTTPGFPLWIGGCKPYKSWSIRTFSTLRADLDGGIAQLDNLDTTAPGAADHTAALSSEDTVLNGGESASMIVAIGGVGFDECGDLPCPWDLSGDGVVDAGDLAQLLGAWGAPYGPAELAQLLGAWGPCP